MVKLQIIKVYLFSSGNEVPVTFDKEGVNMVCRSCDLTLGKVSTSL